MALPSAINLPPDLEANRPSFGTAGRTFFATDTGRCWYDTGSAWTNVTGFALALAALFAEQGSTPAAPASGSVKLYAKSDHKLYYEASTGGEKGPLSTYADPLTTKGDLPIFGSSTARLGVGSNGTVLLADSTQTLGARWEPLVKEIAWTATGDAYLQAGVAMTVDQAVTPNGTFSYDTAVAGALGTFSPASLPCTLAAGDVLRINCTALANGYGCLVLKRTA